MEGGGDEVAEDDVVELVPCPLLVTDPDGAALDLFICFFKHWFIGREKVGECKIIIK